MLKDKTNDEYAPGQSLTSELKKEATVQKAANKMASHDKLPTLDAFRRRFRDAMRAGLPLSKCLDLGTRWTGEGSPTKDQKQILKNSFKDALAAGKSVTDALQVATATTDSYVEELGKTVQWLTLKTPTPTIANKRLEKTTELGMISGEGKIKGFKNQMRDSLKSGMSADKAIKQALRGI